MRKTRSKSQKLQERALRLSDEPKRELDKRIVLETDALGRAEAKLPDRFVQHETVYLRCYEQIEKAAAEYGSQNGIRLVLRSDERPLKDGSEDKSANLVFKRIERPIIYCQGREGARDITDELLKILNDRGR